MFGNFFKIGKEEAISKAREILGKGFEDIDDEVIRKLIEVFKSFCMAKIESEIPDSNEEEHS
jgi:hypothetical protein